MTLFYKLFFTYNDNMKRNITLIFICLLLLGTTTLCAQGTKNIIKGVSKGLGKGVEQTVKVTPAQVAPTAPVSAAVTAASKSPAIPALQTPTAAKNSTTARFVNNNKATLYRIQKAMGISSKKAVENLYRWGAAPLQKPPRPILQPQKAFFVTDFTALPYTQGAIPTLPFGYHADYMYRGMGLPLDGAAVRNILENGLLIKDVGPNNNDRRMAYASAGGLGALKAVSKERVINLTDSPATALYYAQRYLHKGMITLVSVKESHERSDIITFTKDIPANQIQELVALLEIDGNPTWCKVEAVPEGFKIIPYEVRKTTSPTPVK